MLARSLACPSLLALGLLSFCAAPAQAQERGSPDEITRDPEELARRLEERWRWRELWSARDRGPIRALTVDERGRPLVLVDGGVWRHDGVWSVLRDPPALAPGVPIDELAVTCGGLLGISEDLLVFRAEGEPARPVPFALCAERRPRLYELGRGRVAVLGADEVLLVEGERLLRRVPIDASFTPTALALGPRGQLVCASEQGTLLEGPAGLAPLALPEGASPGSSFGLSLATKDGLWLLPHRRGGERHSVVLRGDALALGPATGFLAGAVRVGPSGPVIGTADRTLVVITEDPEELWVDGRPPEREVAAPEDIGELDALALAAGGHLLILDAGGSLWVADLGSRRWSRVEPEGRRETRAVLSLSPAREGGLWAGADHGLLRVQRGEIVGRWTEGAGLDLRTVTAVHEAADGELWVGSGSEFLGVLRFDGRRWLHDRTGFPDACVHAIEEAPDGSLWFLLLAPVVAGEDSGAGAGVARWDGRSWMRWTEEDGLPHGRCYSWARDAEGREHVGTFEGVARREGDGWSLLPWTAGLPARVLHFDRQGVLWVTLGTHARGVHAFRGGRALRLPPELTGLAIGAIAEDERGNLWLTSKSGLHLWDGEVLHTLSNEPGAPALAFWPILIEGRGAELSLVLGSLGSGLVRFHPDDREAPRFVLAEVESAGVDGSVNLHARAEDPWGRTPPSDLRYRWRTPAGSWSRPSEGPSFVVGLEGQAAGPHRVEVVALDGAGNTSAPIELGFEVPLPWHRRALPLAGAATLVVALAAAGLIGGRQRALRRALERRERERLAASEQRFRALVERAEVLFASADHHGALGYLSPRFARLFDAEPPRTLQQLFERARPVPARRDVVPGLLAGREETCALELRIGQGEELRWLWAVLSPRRDEAGAPLGVELAAVDVTERRRAEAEREEREAWRLQVRRLETVGQLAAGVAHDFNNVLTAVLGHADLARGDLEARFGPADPVLENLEQIQRASRRAAGLVRQLLAFSRQQALRPVPVDLDELVRGFAETLRRSLRPGVRLAVHSSGELPRVRVDIAGLEQVLWHLASNAQDALGEDGLLEIATRVATVDGEKRVVLAVRDEGVGMDGDTLQRAFDPFFTTKDVGRGSGLGLAAVHGLVRQAGGSIRVRSEPAHGTTVEILFPVALDEHAPVAEPGDDGVEVAGGERGTILLVEDDQGVRQYAAETLERQGWRVHSAPNAERALSLAEEAGELDLLVSDVVLPGADGPTLARRLVDARPGLPVLFLSGWSGDRLDGLPLEHDLLVKPFAGAELVERVRRALARRLVDRVAPAE